MWGLRKVETLLSQIRGNSLDWGILNWPPSHLAFLFSVYLWEASLSSTNTSTGNPHHGCPYIVQGSWPSLALRPKVHLGV